MTKPSSIIITCTRELAGYAGLVYFDRDAGGYRPTPVPELAAQHMLRLRDQ